MKKKSLYHLNTQTSWAFFLSTCLSEKLSKPSIHTHTYTSKCIFVSQNRQKRTSYIWGHFNKVNVRGSCSVHGKLNKTKARKILKEFSHKIICYISKHKLQKNRATNCSLSRLKWTRSYENKYLGNNNSTDFIFVGYKNLVGEANTSRNNEQISALKK